MALAQEPQRSDDVPVALARHEVADRDEAVVAARPVAVRWDVRAEADDACRARPEASGGLLNALAIGDHEAGAGERALNRAAAGFRALGGEVHVAAVDRDDERLRDPRAQDGVGGGHGVVRVDEVVGEAAAQAA